MGLVSNTENAKKVAPVSTEKKEKPARRGKAPVLFFLLLLWLAVGGYWGYVQRDKLREKFFPPESAKAAQEQVEGATDKKPFSFFRKFFHKDRTIIVKGTLLGEEGGSAVMINEKVIPEGTKINGIRIVEITSQSVVVEVDGIKRRLQIGETFDPDAK